MTSLIALFLMAVASADVTATRLDGSVAQGELRNWADGQLVIAAADGEQALASNELLSLRAASPPPATPADPKAAALPSVELVDGSVLPIDDLTVEGGKVQLKLHSGTSVSGQALSLDVKQLAAVRLQPLESAVATQWDEVRSQNLASDVLVVLKRDGASLDYAEGIVGDVTPAKVSVKLDGDTLSVDRAKVAGFVYFRTKKPTDKDPYCLLQGRDGLKVAAASVALADGVLHVTTVAGAKFDWPVDALELADFSAGKVIYLSDIEPASEQWTPLVALPAAAKVAASFGRTRRNQSAFGGPLTVIAPGDPSSTSGVRIQSYNKGLAIRSRTEIIYKLPQEFRRFVAVAGIDPSASRGGNVTLILLGDDRPLLEKQIFGGAPPEAIEVQIDNTKRLKILVDFGQNLDTGDWLNLCDARILK